MTDSNGLAHIKLFAGLSAMSLNFLSRALPGIDVSAGTLYSKPGILRSGVSSSFVAKLAST